MDVVKLSIWNEMSEFERLLYSEWTMDELKKPLEFKHYNRKTTTCILKLANGFEIVGTSGCEDPTKFSEELGKLYALKDALRKLGEFAAFYRAQKAFEAANSPKELRMERKLSPFEIEELRKMWQADTYQAIVMHEENKNFANRVGRARTETVDAIGTLLHTGGLRVDTLDDTRAVSTSDIVSTSHKLKCNADYGKE